MRPLIFSTAQPPICMAWTNFIFQRVMSLKQPRADLMTLSQSLQQGVRAKGFECPSSSHIVPVIIGDSAKTVAKAQALQEAGFYIMPVRPPTVPKQSARLRISLTAQIQPAELDQLLQLV